VPAAFLQRLFKMIFEIAAVLFLVHGISMLSRLLGRLRDKSYHLSGSMRSRRRAPRGARAAKVHHPETALGFEVLFAGDRSSRVFCREDEALWSPSARTGRERWSVGVEESVCSGAAGLISRKPLGRHPCGQPSRRLFRPCKRPRLGLGAPPTITFMS